MGNFMFIPKHFKVTDMDEIKEFIQNNSFGTIVQEVQAADKLSQNRNETDYQNIIDRLYEEKDSNFKSNSRSDEK